MTDFKTLVQYRRSHRRFIDREIKGEDLQLILRAALMSPTSKGRRNWQFAVVDNKSDLAKLAEAKDMGGQFLRQAPLAIVVMGDAEHNDCWIEDCSIAAAAMQFQAQDIGLGSCWIQMRGRGLSDGHRANDIIHGILGLPDDMEVLCVLAIGYYADEKPPQSEEELKWENVIVKSDD